MYGLSESGNGGLITGHYRGSCATRCERLWAPRIDEAYVAFQSAMPRRRNGIGAGIYRSVEMLHNSCLQILLRPLVRQLQTWVL